ncbi:MAG: hypothetical protein AB1449_02165 [Chloroflexota bacterium]
MILVLGQVGMARGLEWVATWFTPIQWTGYILLADGFVFLLTGDSWLTGHRREFPLVTVLSVGIWLLFEAYNLHLRNWYYVGLPSNPWGRTMGYFWSFATILPGVFETADLVGALVGRRRLTAAWRTTQPSRIPWRIVPFGAAMVILPLALPSSTAAYLFGLVWIGFALLLDPINACLGGPSLGEQWKRGNRLPLLGLLAGGLICGFLWETWNYQAFRAQGAYWVYTVPQPLRVFGWHFGQMPVLGLLGFPPFALELFAFYYLLRRLLRGDRLFGASTPTAGSRPSHSPGSS